MIVVFISNVPKDLLFDEAAEAYFVIFSQTANDTSTITVRVRSSLRIPFHVLHFCGMVMPLDTSLDYPTCVTGLPQPSTRTHVFASRASGPRDSVPGRVYAPLFRPLLSSGLRVRMWAWGL